MSLDDEIMEMEQRVLNAATIEGARYLHHKLDALRAKRADSFHHRPNRRSRARAARLTEHSDAPDDLGAGQ